MLGFANFNVSSVATACQPCSSAPVDIMLVVDRTGSMCSPVGTGAQQGECADLNNAKAGVQTMLGIMDPNIDTIGLVALPPYDTSGTNAVCQKDGAPNDLTINGTSGVAAGYYDDSTLQYLNDPLLSNFKTSATSPLNLSSTLVQHMTSDTLNDQNCIRSFGSTSYDEALSAANKELVKDGRKGVPKVIVFMTDGEANEGSYWNGVTPHGLEPDLDDPTHNFNMYPANSASAINPGDAQPCHSAINVANAIKLTGTTIYTIGYALFDATSGYAYCMHGVWGQIDESTATSRHRLRELHVHRDRQPVHELDQEQVVGAEPPRTPATTSRSTRCRRPSNQQNPCLNTITGDHREMPLITSYDTLQTHRVSRRLLQQAHGGRRDADLRRDRRRHHQGHEPARGRQLLIAGETSPFRVTAKSRTPTHDEREWQSPPTLKTCPRASGEGNHARTSWKRTGSGLRVDDRGAGRAARDRRDRDGRRLRLVRQAPGAGVGRLGRPRGRAGAARRDRGDESRHAVRVAEHA